MNGRGQLERDDDAAAVSGLLVKGATSPPPNPLLAFPLPSVLLKLPFLYAPSLFPPPSQHPRRPTPSTAVPSSTAGARNWTPRLLSYRFFLAFPLPLQQQLPMQSPIIAEEFPPILPVHRSQPSCCCHSTPTVTVA